jgi:hypothetical protein
MIPTPQGRKLIHIGRNGVDFVGVYDHLAVAVECKRLPGAASLRPSKNESTVEEARWLQAYRHCGGFGGFLVHDPEVGRVYAIGDAAHILALSVGKSVTLRNRQGIAVVPSWNMPDDASLASCVRAALAWMVV